MGLISGKAKDRSLVHTLLVALLVFTLVLLIGLPVREVDPVDPSLGGGGGGPSVTYVPLYKPSPVSVAGTSPVQSTYTIETMQAAQTQVTSNALNYLALMGRHIQVNIPDARVQNALIDFKACSKSFEKRTQLFCEQCTGSLNLNSASIGYVSRGSCLNLKNGTRFSQFNLNLKTGKQIAVSGNDIASPVLTGAVLESTGTVDSNSIRMVEGGDYGPGGGGGSAVQEGSPDWTNATTCTSIGKTVIDVLLAYTPEARCRTALRAAGFSADLVPATDAQCTIKCQEDDPSQSCAGSKAGPINAKIASWIAETNQILCNSNVNIWIRPVAVVETKDNELDATSTELPLSNLRSSLLQTSGGKFSELKALRDVVGADLVTVVTDVVSSQDTSCEFAPTIASGAALTSPDPIDNSRNYAFISAKQSCYADSTKRYALARAIGHLMGQGAATNDPSPDNTTRYPGITANARGYRSGGGCWGTVMASPTDSATCTNPQVVPFFSTQTLGSGATIGATIGAAGQYDSASSLNSIASAAGSVADYRAKRYNNVYFVFDRESFAPYVASADPFPDGAYFQIGHAVRHSVCGIAPDPTRRINDYQDNLDCGVRLERIQNGLVKQPTIDDLVLVGPGFYRERLGITSSITLQSMAGAASTVINGKFDRNWLDTHHLDSPSSPLMTAANGFPDGWIYTNGFQGNSGVIHVSGVPSADFAHATDPYHPPLLSTANFNSQNVLPFGTDKFASPTIDGFTITGGFGDRVAGGIYVGGFVNATIINNIIRDNTSYSGFGAGLTIEGSAGVIKNNIFFNNRIEQVETCVVEGRPTSPPYSTSPMNCDPTSSDPAVQYNIHNHNCYWGHDFVDSVWWPTSQSIGAHYNPAVTPLPPRVQLTSPGKYFCHQIPRPLMATFEPFFNYNYYRQQYDQSDVTVDTDNRIGGAAIYVSNVCRYNPLNSVEASGTNASDPNLRSIEGVATCRAESVTGTLEISDNLIYGNSYQNGGTSSLFQATDTRSKLGGAILIDNPLDNTKIRGLPGTPISTANHLTVKLLSNTIVGNKILDSSSSLTGTAGAGIGCVSGSTLFDVDNSLITGNSANSAILTNNFSCAGAINADTLHATIDGDPGLPSVFSITNPSTSCMAAMTNPATSCAIFRVDPVAILNAAPSSTTGVNDSRIQPTNISDPNFPLRLSDGTGTTGQCVCVNSTPMRMHAALDRSLCTAGDVDILGTSRCYTLSSPADDKKVCSSSPANTSAIRDRGAIEKMGDSFAPNCPANTCGGGGAPSGGQTVSPRLAL